MKLSFLNFIMTFLFFITFSCQEKQTNNGSETRNSEIEIPDFLETEKPKAQVLLLGVFHFKDAGLDGYKPQYDIDIKSEAKQKELDILLDSLESFNPTQVIIEANLGSKNRIDSLYSEYLKGNYVLGSNEIFQIGFQIAKRAGIKELVMGDANSRLYNSFNESDSFESDLKKMLIEQGLEKRLENNYGEKYTQLYTFLDSIKTQMPLSEYLKLINDGDMLKLKHGHYLLGEIGVNDGENFPMADMITSWWYSRNMRIFSNIRKSIRDKDERVLVIFGSGHMPIIRHAVESSPEMKLVEVSEIL